MLTTAALRSLQRALPDSQIDLRRFRPNLLVEAPGEGLPEYAWIGRRIRIGRVLLRGTIPCARCGFTTMEQPGIALDARVLQTLVADYARNFGIYCDVLEAGDIQQGDEVSIED